MCWKFNRADRRRWIRSVRGKTSEQHEETRCAEDQLRAARKFLSSLTGRQQCDVSSGIAVTRHRADVTRRKRRGKCGEQVEGEAARLRVARDVRGRTRAGIITRNYGWRSGRGEARNSLGRPHFDASERAQTRTHWSRCERL